MQISVNLRQQIAKMCCKAGSMWKSSTSSNGKQQQHQQQEQQTVTTVSQSHGHNNNYKKKKNSSIRNYSLSTICKIVLFLMMVMLQTHTTTAKFYREGLSGESKKIQYYTIYSRLKNQIKFIMWNIYMSIHHKIFITLLECP